MFFRLFLCRVCSVFASNGTSVFNVTFCSLYDTFLTGLGLPRVLVFDTSASRFALRGQAHAAIKRNPKKQKIRATVRAFAADPLGESLAAPVPLPIFYPSFISYRYPLRSPIICRNRFQTVYPVLHDTFQIRSPQNFSLSLLKHDLYPVIFLLR